LSSFHGIKKIEYNLSLWIQIKQELDFICLIGKVKITYIKFWGKNEKNNIINNL